MNHYVFGGSTPKRKLGRLILSVSHIIRQSNLYIHDFIDRMCNRWYKRASRMIEDSKTSKIDRLKIVFTSPRHTSFEFHVNGDKFYLYDSYNKSEETVDRYLKFKKGELDVKIKWEHYSYVKDNQNRWRL